MKNYIVFDLDGTLIDSMPVWRNVGADFLKEMKIVPPENLLDVLKKQTLPETAEYFKKTWNLSLSVTEIIAKITAMVEDAYCYHVPLKPYALEYLKTQKAKGTKMCVLTASESSYVQAAMNRLAINQYFEFVLTCTELGLNKHTPQVFIKAMEQLGGNITDTVVFEDAPYAIRTAKEAGFYVVAVADEATKDEEEKIRRLSDQYIYTFKELI